MSEFDTGYSVVIGKPVVHAEKKATGSSVSFPCEAIPDGSYLVSLEVNGIVKAYRESMDFSSGSCTVGDYTLAYSSYALTVSGVSNNNIVRVMVEPLDVKTTDAFRAAIMRGVEDIKLYEKIVDSVDEWLDDHPEATTTVQDGAVTTAKLADGAVTEAKMDDDFNAKLAKVDGSYEGMTVGNAEQLVSSVGIEDSTPYNFRTSGGSTEIGDSEELNAVVGVSVPWNQLIPNNQKTFSRVPSGTQTYDTYTILNSSIANHIYYINAKYTYSGSKTKLRCYCASGSSNYGRPSYDVNANSSVSCAWLVKPTSNMSISCGISNIETTEKLTSADAWSVDNLFIIDLTAMFGSAIADYVYTLESGTAGAGIAWMKKYGWFTKPYYPYAAANLQSVKTSAHKMVGFNAYDHSTGKAKVVGGNVYQITGTYTALSLNGSTITPDASGYFTPSESGEITVTGGNSTNTCIHLKWDGERDGEYEPYEAHEYALSDITLRGMLKLDANNNLYYDGDRYLPDGTVERYWGERAYTSGDATDGSTMITDGTNTVYKLTTPTTESADPYTELQVCDDFGTEEFVDAATRDFDMPVGHNTVYQPNLRAKLEMAPNSPDGDGDYLVRQTNGVNEYVLFSEVKELPDYPTTDGTYVLKCTVADGTATLSWVSEE